jgi:hypothetical protein
LTDADAAMRREIILALLKYGSAAQDFVPVLTKVYEKDRYPKVRVYAANALVRINQQQARGFVSSTGSNSHREQSGRLFPRVLSAIMDWPPPFCTPFTMSFRAKGTRLA